MDTLIQFCTVVPVWNWWCKFFISKLWEIWVLIPSYYWGPHYTLTNLLFLLESQKCLKIIRKNFQKLVSLWNYLVIIILWQGFRFLNNKAMHKMLLAISLELSLLILLVRQQMKIYLRWLGTGKCSWCQIICWVQSPSDAVI